ncbi:glycosyltransferase [Candidatus Thiosymbion oneisti]|uniref:glycosyltransferase n=1 Tax=Candidatus Thiosymbion oneisti TaxID=589554 RepID=UPI000A9E7C20|nr:glycosyltransferase family 2 protein [Candidatus Thiosymbion oneisti]
MSESNPLPENCPPPELAVIVPVYNEAGNIEALTEQLRHSLQGLDWELIFVDDDSPDGSTAKAQEIARRDRRVRVLRRIGRRGLSSACIEGMLATVAPYLAVLDGDLQHDETLLPSMLQTLKREGLDIVVGSRYLEGGSLGTWNRRRRSMSRFASRLARTLVKADLSDPMSGFFMLNSTLLHGCVRNLSGIGFKILLDIFASSPRPLRFKEIPYVFRERRAGESKLDNAVLWEYLLMLLQKTMGSMIPVRFIGFSLIGGSGVIVHMVVLWVLFRLLGASFISGQAVATLVAMTTNFFLNNMLTYRDLRLRRWQLLRGWLSFVLACSIGAIANVGIATYLFQAQSYWVISAFAGILVGVVWNYAVTAVYTWRHKAG